ncbi:heavy metal translocating P-type ATPase [Thiohalobacter sp. IOR34]|uniref:heavy metal translocating P-type ATPase n=1 Tax=Thiohalobacter sp. IOR34 TaxID=3057176 RepID=UPI0025B0098D|nr:heavy metal translocating P-type ATPase [Thiohalobacter sp. IOR34]WJW75735.1 heavy metal translocating P-type ATPase [Thiohalobacter sp. IOR34]
MSEADPTTEAASQPACFHCGLPVPKGAPYQAVIDGQPRPMCCPGCQAVAESIVAAGLGDFYRHREGPARTVQELVPEALREMALYDQPELQKSFVHAEAGSVREASLILEGITCAACVWLNERHVGALPGVLSFQVNYSTHRARVRWDDSRIHLSDILKAISAIGYIAHPFDPGRQEAVYKKERGQALRRIGVAALGTMQVMMIAVGLYAGDYQGMDPELREFLRWVSLLIALPVVLYSARPFFQSAWRDLRRRRPGMDVPVALAIGGAFLASAYNTLTGGAEVYYDSVTMFTFFLLTGRYLEMSARHRAGQAAEELVRLMPATATRIAEDGSEERVAAVQLEPGDRVLVRPGETVPADGRVLEGQSSVDESLLSGESLPQPCAPGQPLIGGTVNIESPLLMQVEKVGEDTVLSAIVRLLDRAQTEKPRVARLADRVAGWFVVALLLLAAAVAWYWWRTDPAHAFAITLSVLVVTCPCALSLATPVAVTAATGALTRLGLLTTRSHALETLARVSHMVFDKTGTLTEGRLQLVRVQRLGQLTRDRCLAIAAALEQGSEHPLARALVRESEVRLAALEVRAVPGEGVEGEVQGRRYRIGSREFALGLGGRSRPLPAALEEETGTLVFLADGRGLLAVFVFEDRMRPGAQQALQALRELGIEVSLLSGDAERPVRRVARALDIEHAVSGLKPQQKLAHLKALQAQGAVVAMVGDGVNDAPVLAGAQVSIAMGGGTQLAASAADMVLLSEQLPHLADGVRTARRTLSVIRQNLGWAAVYNLCAVPLAVAGWVAPWMAAIGMSLSSLLVVLNSLRLRRIPGQ